MPDPLGMQSRRRAETVFRVRFACAILSVLGSAFAVQHFREGARMVSSSADQRPQTLPPVTTGRTPAVSVVADESRPIHWAALPASVLNVDWSLREARQGVRTARPPSADRATVIFSASTYGSSY